jgi:hypothetical protein
MGRVLFEWFPDIVLLSYFCSISSADSAQSEGVGNSIRSSPFLGTNRTPLSFTDGSVFSAIQRRTVLRETPHERAISPARRYSGASVIADPPLAPRRTAPARVGQIPGQPGAPAGARAQSAHRAPQMGCSLSMLTLVGACRPAYRESAVGSEWPNRCQFGREAPLRIVRTRLRQASSAKSISIIGSAAACKKRMRGPSAIPSLGLLGPPTEVLGSLPVILR